jgi:NAD(P)-dependent dehydrogenase (short-subunit alcohol dehydrogenase family)
MIRFDGQVAIVTGAGKGIGRAYAETLAARGAKVIVNNRRHAGEATSSADEVVAAIRAAGGEAAANYDAVDAAGAGERMVQQALDAYGDLHILMCNAGVAHRGVLHKQTEQQMRDTVEINVLGSLEPLRAAMPHLRQRKYGRVLLTTSGAGLAGSIGFAAYGASKAAMHGLAASATLEADRAGVLINVISPGALTNMTRWMLDLEGFDAAGRAAAMPIQPVAEVAAYMVSRQFDGRAEIWSVSGGSVHVTRLLANPGIKVEPAELTAERAAELKDQIRDMSQARVVELAWTE